VLGQLYGLKVALSCRELKGLVSWLRRLSFGHGVAEAPRVQIQKV
jgi:hypothetical protein